MIIPINLLFTVNSLLKFHLETLEGLLYPLRAWDAPFAILTYRGWQWWSPGHQACKALLESNQQSCSCSSLLQLKSKYKSLVYTKDAYDDPSSSSFDLWLWECKKCFKKRVLALTLNCSVWGTGRNCNVLKCQWRKCGLTLWDADNPQPTVRPLGEELRLGVRPEHNSSVVVFHLFCCVEPTKENIEWQAAGRYLDIWIQTSCTAQLHTIAAYVWLGKKRKCGSFHTNTPLF